MHVIFLDDLRNYPPPFFAKLPPLNRDIITKNLQLTPENFIFFHFFTYYFFVIYSQIFNVSFMGVVLISQIILRQKKTQEPVYLNMLETHFFHNIGSKVIIFITFCVNIT